MTGIPIAENNSSNIDGGLKAMLSGMSPYMYRMVAPYYESREFVIRDSDSIAVLLALEESMKELGWTDVVSQLKDVVVTGACLIETDNAYRCFINAFCKAFVRIRSDDKVLGEFLQKELEQKKPYQNWSRE